MAHKNELYIEASAATRTGGIVVATFEIAQGHGPEADKIGDVIRAALVGQGLALCRNCAKWYDGEHLSTAADDEGSTWLYCDECLGKQPGASS